MQEKLTIPKIIKEKPSHLHIEEDRLQENLRRMGCYIILYSYEELKKWIRPKSKYSPKQLQFLKKYPNEDPLGEVKTFFFEPNGVDVVLEAFSVRISLDLIRRVTKKMVAEAESCIAGNQPSKEYLPPEAWEMLVNTIMQNTNQESTNEDI